MSLLDCARLSCMYDLSRARVPSDCGAGWPRFGRAHTITAATWPELPLLLLLLRSIGTPQSEISDTRVRGVHVHHRMHFMSQLDQVDVPVYRALCVGARRSTRGGGALLCRPRREQRKPPRGRRKVLVLSARSLAHTTYARSCT